MRRSVLLLLPLVLAGCGAKHAADPATTKAPRTQPVARVTRPPTLAANPATALRAPVQDAAFAALDGTRGILLGGLDVNDVSTADIRIVTARGNRTIGTLPRALHDTAAVRLGGSVYLFGGGNATQYDTIYRVDPRSARTAVAGRLPAPSSDQAAAAIGGTAYVVGGYTGTSWLDTIVAWRPGSTAHVVGHLPSPVRYAAVAALGGKLVVAGGSLPDGTATRAVYVFDPATRKVKRIGSLPAETTHADAATFGGAVYVIGGRGASTTTQTDRIVAIDGAHVRLAGRLAQPLSDSSPVPLAHGILVAGGRSTGGTVADVNVLAPGTRRLAHVPANTPGNVYAADGAGMLSPVVKHDPPYVYVPNSRSDTVDVVDQRTFRIVRHFQVGLLPQHIVPSWDLKTLYVTNDVSNSLTVVDPRTGKPGRTIPVDDPYNMYFTPDGRYAVVVAERLQRLDFRDAHTFRLVHSLHVDGCRGVDHLDYSADGSYLVASCEFAGKMIEVDVKHQKIVGWLTLNGGNAKPQDVKLSPDGKVFYVADMVANGVWELSGKPFRVLKFQPTGRGAHGLYPSRDATRLYVTNRDEGSITVIDFATRKIVTTWRLPGGGSPDMGGVSADGSVLWLTGRYNGVLYAISTKDGSLIKTIRVGAGPHGASVWPQPGRYSLGHTGILR